MKRRGTVFFVAARVFLGWPALAGQDDAWHPARAQLMTRWAAQVTATNVLPEYPRPQMVRPQWLNLNGLWPYAITPSDAAPPTACNGKILVPFPIESALSGVMTPLDAKSTLWCRRGFALPAGWAGKRVLLHFGAVDWAARIFVNGHEIGQHQGGYDAFTLDITPQLNQAGEQQLLVAVFDPTEGDQPRGKQSRKPEGIFYTQVSGVWQSVWLEPVSEISIEQLKMTPDLAGQALRLRVNVSSVDQNLRVEASASAQGAPMGQVAGMANAELVLPIASPHPWTPEDPFLYDLTVRLSRQGREEDQVTSYFGMRSVEVRKASDGITRITLNGRPLFQMGGLGSGILAGWPLHGADRRGPAPRHRILEVVRIQSGAEARQGRTGAMVLLVRPAGAAHLAGHAQRQQQHTGRTRAIRGGIAAHDLRVAEPSGHHHVGAVQ